MSILTYKDPNISPPGPTTTEPLPEDIAQRNAQLVEKYAEELYTADAATIFQWTAEHAPGAIVVTLSMENTVLAELASRHLPTADFLFLDTEFHFPETLAVAEAVAERYSNRLITAKARLRKEQQARTYGPALYVSNPGACCRMRKVEPLAVALSPYVGWITGLRRADGPTRAQAPALSLDQTGRLKISPIITWSLEATDQFIAENALIKHPLTEQGYPSIGCATCTLPVTDGGDPRAGRWAGNAKTECGLHS